jgi:hypothetical protein
MIARMTTRNLNFDMDTLNAQAPIAKGLFRIPAQINCFTLAKFLPAFQTFLRPIRSRV